MLIDTGFGKDEPAIRSQIEQLIAPGLPLSLFPLRLNEFMSINNVAAFAGHFNVEQCYTSNIDAALWFDFGSRTDGRDILESMKVVAVTRSDTIQLGGQGRPIDVMQAPNSPDRHALAVRSCNADAVLVRHVHPCLARQSAGALDRDRSGRRHDVDTRRAVVPAQHALLVAGRGADQFDAARNRQCVRPVRRRDHRSRLGCVLHGREVVARHYRMLDEVLKACDASVAVSRYVGRDEER